MNASNADEVCDLTPIPSPVVYKNDESRAEDESFSTELEFFRIVATILIFFAWVYVLVKGFLDYDANRADVSDDGSRNEVEGDNGLHELFNNANDLETNPDAAAAGPVFGPVQLAPADMPPASAEARENDASPVTRQAAPPTERRRRQRLNDVMSVELLAAFDMDEAAPAAADDDVRAAESVQGAADQDIKPKNPLRHVRKYVRVQKPEDMRSKEPETSDEDLLPSYKSKTETNAPTDDYRTRAAAVAMVTLNVNTSVAETQQVANAGNVVDCRTGKRSAADVLLPSDHLEDCQATSSNQQPLENDLEPPYGRNAESSCLAPIAVFGRHGTGVDKRQTTEAGAKTESKVLDAVRRDDSRTSEVTQPTSHRILDCLNERLLEQLTTDFVRRLDTQTISEERLRRELDVETRARHDAQSCYEEVLEQLKRCGSEWGSAHPETQEEEEQLEQDQKRNIETTALETTQDSTADVTTPPDTMS